MSILHTAPRLVPYLLAIALTVANSAPTSAQTVPDKISFQGLVTKPNGVPLDSVATMKFFLWRGSTPLWTETQTDIVIEDGVFNVVLGSVNPLDDVPFHGPISFQASIGSSDTLNSKMELVSVPFALGLRNLRVDPETAVEGPNMIGGWSGNIVLPGVEGAFIGGGGDPVHSAVPFPNTVEADYGVVVGGSGNTASSLGAMVGGGSQNMASGGFSFVGGGQINRAIGGNSVVPGGTYNTARGLNSFAAGELARANHDGSFVWSDASGVPILDTMATTADNQFLIRAAGGVGIGTNKPKRGLTISREDQEAAYQLELRNVGTILGGGNFDGIAFTQEDSGATELASLKVVYHSNGRPDMSFSVRDAADALFIKSVSGNVGIGTTNPMAELDVNGELKATTITVANDLMVSGDLNVAGTKNFKIDHPLDPENKFLVHYSLESDEVLNVYTGNVMTDATGNAEVELPDWFEALNRDFRYQLTVIGSFARATVEKEIEDNRFTIRTEDPKVKVSWQVTAIRDDPAARRRQPVEQLKHPERHVPTENQ